MMKASILVVLFLAMISFVAASKLTQQDDKFEEFINEKTTLTPTEETIDRVLRAHNWQNLKDATLARSRAVGRDKWEFFYTKGSDFDEWFEVRYRATGGEYYYAFKDILGEIRK